MYYLLGRPTKLDPNIAIGSSDGCMGATTYISAKWSAAQLFSNIFNTLTAGLGRDDLIIRPSIWAGLIRACNNLDIFFIFWAFFNFDLEGINFDLKSINFQN